METEELRAVLAAVDRVSKRLQLDPLTILAVIEVESRFDPTAVSRKGARGLMQLRLETARALAREMGIPWTTDDRVFEPELNVVLGASYLGRLVERFGSLDAGLAAFHSGPGRIESRRARDGSIPLEYANRVGEQVLLLQARASL